MLLINFIKFFALFALIFSPLSACRFWRGAENAVPSPTPFIAEELKSEIPFASKEPEVFQAEFVVTANDATRTTFTARNGTNRRIDYNFGTENQLTNLQTDKNYLILLKRQIYAENSSSESAEAADDWTLFLTTEWLNTKTPAGFEKLETVENITKYRVLLGEKEASEIIVYFDEAQKIIVRQEFYSISGEQKTLSFTFELKNLKLQTDEDTFAVPNDFKKISIAELRRELNKYD